MGRRVWEHPRGEHPGKSAVLVTPTLLCEGDQRPPDLGFSGAPAVAATSVCAVQDEMTHAFRVRDGIRNGHGATLRYPKEGESLETQAVHHRFEVVHPGFQ